MASSTRTIPQFLLPRGIPTTTATLLRTLRTTPKRTLSSTRQPQKQPESSKNYLLEKPDKFRPPSHPSRRVVQTRNGRTIPRDPVNYPGPKLSEKEIEEAKRRQYPHMFPPEGTLMYKFLTNRWIHVWIALGVLTSLATFTFTTTFKHSSPYAHLLPPWSALLSHPIDTVSQVVSVYKMHVQHTSLVAREHRQRRVEDAEKRRRYRVAHGLEEDSVEDAAKGKSEAAADVVEGDDQSPVAVEALPTPGSSEEVRGEYVDWEGKKRPVKKWFGIW